MSDVQKETPFTLREQTAKRYAVGSYYEMPRPGGTIMVMATDYDALTADLAEALRERDEAETAVSRYENTINERDRELAEARELLEEWRDDGMPLTQTDLFLARTEGK